jgi:flagellar basal body-associated protein FliL
VEENMWRRKKLMIITMLAAVVILLVGIIGGSAFAQSGATPTPGDTGKTTLLARVAAILGIEQQQLEDAFAQAQKDMMQEQMTNRLNRMVEEGKITQEQADQYLEWQQSRPDVPPFLNGRGAMGFPGKFRGMPGMRGNMVPPSPTMSPATN